MKTWLWTVLIVAAIFIGGMAVVYPMLKGKERLKVFQPSDVNPRLVDKEKQKVKKDHTIADFTLINQNGETITQEIFSGKIYVADFFFTTCPSICPKMSEQMVRIQKEFEDNPMVMLLSHSVTPEIDSVPLLADYADKYEADPERWHLTTGDKRHIYELARKSYFAVLDEGDGGVQDFIHTENFVLIDPKRRIRGFYDGTSPEDISRCIKDIYILLDEYPVES